MKNTGLIILLISIVVFSFFKATVAIKEKNDLLNSLNQVKAELVAAELEKQRLCEMLAKQKEIEKALTQKNLLLKNNLKAGVNKLTQRSRQAQEEIGQLSALVSTLKAENELLKQEKDNLTNQLNVVYRAKANLEARLGSASELKKAIRELRRQVRRVSQDIKTKAKAQEISEKNFGYIVKDGKPTYPSPKVKIEVSPAPENR